MRRSASRSASTVRAPSVVSVSAGGHRPSTPRARPGSRPGARCRYHRVDSTRIGTAASEHSASSGDTRNVATSVSTVVTAATIVSGTANRTVRASASTSLVVAGQQVAGAGPLDGRTAAARSARSRKSSRRSASTCSPSTNDVDRGPPGQHRLRDHERRPAARRPGRRASVVVPSCTDWTRAPSSRGPASPATAASACSTSIRVSVRGCRRDQRSARTPGSGVRWRPAACASRRCSRAWPVSTEVALAAGDHARGRAGSRRMQRAVRDPTSTTVPPSRKATSSHCSSSSGLVVITTVVRPARAARSRSAIRASVCASTALVGSSSTRTSGSATSARASTSRWRWPPEKRPAALLDLGVQAVRAARRGRPRRRRSRAPSSSAASSPAACPSGSSSSRSVPDEQPRVLVADEHAAGGPSSTGQRRPAAPRRGSPASTSVGVDVPAEPVGQRGRLLGHRGRRRRPAGRRATTRPLVRVDQVGRPLRLRRRRRGLGAAAAAAAGPRPPGPPRPSRWSPCRRPRSRCAAGSPGRRRSRRTRPAGRP